MSGFAVSWDARQREIIDELRRQACWDWGLFTADQLIEATRVALTPSVERVRAALAEMTDRGELLLNAEGRYTVRVDTP